MDVTLTHETLNLGRTPGASFKAVTSICVFGEGTVGGHGVWALQPSSFLVICLDSHILLK